MTTSAHTSQLAVGTPVNDDVPYWAQRVLVLCRPIMPKSPSRSTTTWKPEESENLKVRKTVNGGARANAAFRNQSSA